MTTRAGVVYAGVDTHGRTHHAAVIDGNGQVLGDREFPATKAGYGQLEAWLRRFGSVEEVGVEGPGSYGAGLTRQLSASNLVVVEVDRPDRRNRRRRGKSDPIDALAAARAALSGEADGVPKTRCGPVEAIRALGVGRRSSQKARTAALNRLHGIIVSAPEDLRGALSDLNGQRLVRRCAAYRIGDGSLAEPSLATKAARLRTSSAMPM